jgi:hypothetical protein
MNKIIPAIVSVSVVIGLGLVLQSQFTDVYTPTQKSETSIDSEYVAANLLLKQKLEENQFHMSSPIKMSNQEGIDKYCSVFASEEKQKLIQYCTSTEITDKNDEFLGNIYVVGTPNSPQVILTLIQADKSMSQLGSVKTIFETESKTMICDCWSEQKPGGLDNMDSWIDGLWQFHQSDTKPHSKSNTLLLYGKSMQLELTTNEAGYLWQFIMYR